MSAPITQKALQSLYDDFQGIREDPFQVRKKTTKLVYIPVPGENIDTYIDGPSGSVVKEVSRTVPKNEKDGSYIVICSPLQNSTKHQQKYFIPWNDFVQRYTLMNGDPITPINKPIFYTDIITVRAKGIATAFKALPSDTPSGQYEQPPSWGPGFASGANQDGYWMASTQQPDEYYFIPTKQFNNDYIKITYNYFKNLLEKKTH